MKLFDKDDPHNPVANLEIDSNNNLVVEFEDGAQVTNAEFFEIFGDCGMSIIEIEGAPRELDKFVDRLRTERSREARNRPLDGARPVSDEPPPVEVQRLYDAIAALPPKQSAVITLRKLMELEYADIAAILGISAENCRSHCRHGLQRLRETLGEEEA